MLNYMIAYHNDQKLTVGRLRFVEQAKDKMTKLKNQIQDYRLYNTNLAGRKVRAG